MKKSVFCFLLITTLTSCKTEHFKAPCGVEYLTSISVETDGTIDAVCIVDNTCNSDEAEIKPIIACNNTIGVKPEYKSELDIWVMDKLTRLEKCLYSKKNCK